MVLLEQLKQQHKTSSTSKTDASDKINNKIGWLRLKTQIKETKKFNKHN